MSAHDPAIRAETAGAGSPAVAEARRFMEICNACRYCEGYCPVFPAMERRRAFSEGDLGHLANLCHNCKGCYYACQYAPPHEFNLNLPRALADLRVETWERYAWPRGLARLFQRNGLFLSVATGLSLGLVLLLSIVLTDPGVFTGVHRGPGAFYAVIPHGVMVAVGLVTFGFAVLAMTMGGIGYWRASGGGPVRWEDVKAALKAAGTTRHLDGGGGGCNDIDERYSMGRRHLHLATMWGFLLCFAATCVATVMDYGFGWVAPYSWYSAPVVLGTVGGIGLTIGPAGLFWLKIRADQRPLQLRHLGMEHGFLALLFLTATTGLALLFFRHTSAMGGLLAIHLGFVLGLFLVLPYSKMVHGVYRTLALVREAGEAARERERVIGLQAEARS